MSACADDKLSSIWYMIGVDWRWCNVVTHVGYKTKINKGFETDNMKENRGKFTICPHFRFLRSCYQFQYCEHHSTQQTESTFRNRPGHTDCRSGANKAALVCTKHRPFYTVMRVGGFGLVQRTRFSSLSKAQNKWTRVSQFEYKRKVVGGEGGQRKPKQYKRKTFKPKSPLRKIQDLKTESWKQTYKAN